MNSKASSNDPKYEIFYHINLSVVWEPNELKKKIKKVWFWREELEFLLAQIACVGGGMKMMSITAILSGMGKN